MTQPNTPRPTPAPADIRPAATVLLLREEHSRLEVLMTRRAAQLAFMGSLWVFPGGRLEEADCSAAMAARVLPEARDSCAALMTKSGDPLDASVSIGLHVAGCRETFEESGVLLARRRDGSPCDAALIQRLKSHRAELAATGGAFLKLLLDEDLYLDIAPLVYWAHWITPPYENRRFDTRFFAIEVPSGQDASADRTETTDHAWITPQEALERARNRDMMMAPPTLATLTDLDETFARYSSLPAMLEGERRRHVPPILPRLVIDGERITVVLPWDPEYARLDGEPCTVAATYPPHLARQPSRREMRMPGKR
jgi:8-oxo-dGTP pyrophosphatase MutT (NUDIX family)